MDNPTAVALSGHDYFLALCQYTLQIPPPLVQQWWEGLVASSDARCRRIVHKFNTYHGTDTGFAQWVFWAISPRLLVETLETLHEAGVLSRKEATLAQEAVFVWMKRTEWK